MVFRIVITSLRLTTIMYVETLGGLVDADTLDGVPSTVLSLLGLYGLDGCHGVVGGAEQVPVTAVLMEIK